jgi:hypothetical protein
MDTETQNLIDYYTDKGSKHLTSAVFFIILSVIVYFIFFHGQEFSFQNLITVLPLTGLVLIFLAFLKCGFSTAGFIGAIISIALFVFAAYKLDDFLIANNLPTDDSVYEPIFGTIASVYFLWHLILGVINMKHSSSIINSSLNEAHLNLGNTRYDK